MINIFYTSFTEPLENCQFLELLALLPDDLRERNQRFLRWQDQHANLFGKLLLMKALSYYNVTNNISKLMAYDQYKRPYLTLPKYDFNISHSGDYVICAIAQNIRLGIDIEKINNRNFDNFENSMTTQQWEEIHASNNSLQVFYKYWTIKESVSKADGRGFFIPYNKLEVIDNTVQYEGKLWFLQDINIAEEYSVTMAANKLSPFKLHALNFKESFAVNN